MNDLRFKPINLQKDGDLCVRFRADSFSISFGHERDFWGEDGHGDKRYLEWLQKKITSTPPMAYHLWSENEILGQIELDYYKGDKTIGYVNLFYLAHEHRGRGAASHLDDFTTSFFKSLGVNRLLLSVSPTNQRALSFYKKNGWRDLGPRFSTEEIEKNSLNQVHLMEKLVID